MEGLRNISAEAYDEDEQEFRLAVGQKKPGQKRQKQISFEKPPKSILLKKKDQGKSILKKFSAGGF